VSFFTNGIFSGDFPNLAPNSDSPSQTVIIWGFGWTTNSFFWSQREKTGPCCEKIPPIRPPCFLATQSTRYDLKKGIELRKCKFMRHNRLDHMLV
jgi:hypothetical protein